MSTHTQTPRQKRGTFVFALTTAVPGLVLGGFFGPLVDLLPLSVWVVIATVGGSFGGGIYGERAPVKTALCGALAGCGTVLAIPYYTEMRASLSATFFSIEFLIPIVVGSLPGIALYKLWVVRAHPVADG